MKPENTLYEVLEISPHASNEIVKAAYRCLAQFHHPDKNAANDHFNEDENANANYKLMEINNAYSILSNPVTRQIYDRKMGFHGQTMDRRNACAAQDNAFSTMGSRPNESRPFGFRPL